MVRRNAACRRLLCDDREPVAGRAAFSRPIIRLVASQRCTDLQPHRCCPRAFDWQAARGRGRRKPFPPGVSWPRAKGFACVLTRAPSRCSSVGAASHRIASAAAACERPREVVQSRWRRAMGRPPPAQEPDVPRRCRMHEVMSSRDEPCDMAADRSAGRRCSSTGQVACFGGAKRRDIRVQRCHTAASAAPFGTYRTRCVGTSCLWQGAVCGARVWRYG